MESVKNIKEWQGQLINLKNDTSLFTEFNKVAKDIISKNANTKTADCFIETIYYNEDNSIRSISGSVTIKWKVYRRKNYSLDFYYSFENGNIKNSVIDKIY